MGIVTFGVPDLLGDAIYTSFSIAAFLKANEGAEVHCLLDKPSWCGGIYRYIDGVTDVRVKQPGETAQIQVDLSTAFSLCVGRYRGERPFWHTISETLGVESEYLLQPPIKLPQVPIHKSLRHRVILSPYSVSCSSRQGQPANKMLSAEHWQQAFDAVYAMWQNGWIGKPLFIGEEGERMLPDTAPEFELLGEDLLTVATVLKNAQCIIGVDTGTIRLANMLGTQAFFTKPLGLGQMFIPNWGGYVAHEFGNPGTYTPMQFREFVEHCIKSRL